MAEIIRILYIDNNSSDRALVEAALEEGGAGSRVTALATREEFEAQLSYGTYDVILSECNVLGCEGLRVLDFLNTHYPDLPVIIVTRAGSEERGVDAMRRGAADYILKTAHTIGQLNARIEAVLEKVRLREKQLRSIRVLRESENQFRSLFEKSADGMLLADVESRKFYLSNPTMSQMLGYTKDEIGHLSVDDIHPPETLPSVLRTLDQLTRGEKPLAKDIPVMRKDRTVFYADITSYLFEWAGRPAIMGVFRDISDRKQAEEALRASESRFRNLIDQASDGIFVTDLRGKHIDVNPSGCSMLGYTREEFLRLNMDDLLPAEDRQRLRDMREKVKTGNTVVTQHRMRRKDGSLLPVEISARMLENGALQGIVRNITERTRTEEALKREHAFISAVLDTTGALVVVLDPQGRIIRFNRGCEQSTGYTFAEIQGTYLWDRLLVQEEIEGVKKVFNDLRVGHYPNQHENYWLTKTGKRRMISWLNTAIVDENKAVEYIIGTGIDVTERQQKQEELERIFSLTPDMITITSAEGIFLQVNPSVKEILGYSENEVIGKSWREFIHPEDREPTLAALAGRTKKETAAMEFVNRCRAKDGTYRWLEWKTHPVTTDGQTYAIARDITNRKMVEEVLRASEMKFRSLYESILEGFISVDMDGNFMDFNNSMGIMLGYSAVEMSRLNYQDITPPRWHTYEENIIQKQVLVRGYSDIYEKECIRKNGTIIPVELRAYLIRNEKGSSAGMWAFVRDITGRKKVEDDLRSAENKFRSLVEQSLAGVYIIQGSRFAYVNPKFCEIFGYSQKEIVERLTVDDFVHPEDRILVNENLRKRLEGEVQSLDYSFRGIRKDGALRDIEVFGTYTDINGQPAVIGTLLDITERKQAEEALHKSEERFRSLVLSSSDVITIHDEHALMLYATPSMERILGYKPIDIVGRNPFELVHPDDLATVRGAFEDVYQRRNTGNPTEYRFRHANGSWVHLESVANNLLHHPEIKGIILTSRDVTERKHVQDELNASFQQMRQLTARIQAVREEESTRIAREIHDELGQLLTGIKIDLSFLEDMIGQSELTKRPKLGKQITSTSELVDRAILSVRKVTTELRPAILDSLGLSAAIEWQAEEFQSRTSIACECRTSAGQLSLNRDSSTAVFRVLQESLTNIARHAKATRVQISLSAQDDRVVMEISDNGRGISEADVQKVNTFGILGMRERVSLLNGTFEIRGISQKGTLIRVTIPILP